MKKILLLLTLLTSSFAFAEEKQEDTILEKANEKRYAQTFLLPINSAPRTSFLVKIPSGFKSVQTLTEFEKGVMIEYIPQNEDVDHWSEIITVHKFIGMKLQATKIVNEVKNQLMLNTKDSKILINDKKGSIVAHLLMQYTHEGVLEILSAYYYSGPYDCVGVQYTIRVSPGLSRDAALKKIADFQKTVEII